MQRARCWLHGHSSSQTGAGLMHAITLEEHVAARSGPDRRISLRRTGLDHVYVVETGRGTLGAFNEGSKWFDGLCNAHALSRITLTIDADDPLHVDERHSGTRLEGVLQW